MPRGFLQDRFLRDPFMTGVTGIWTKRNRDVDGEALGFMESRLLRDPFLQATASQWTKREKEVETP